MFADVYQSNSKSGSTTCLGHECTRLSYTVCTICLAAAMAVSVLLWYRLRSQYRKHDATIAAMDSMINTPAKTNSGTELAI